MPTDEEMSLI